MLSDFLLLEHYYDSPATALFYEDLSRRYGPAAMHGALRAGYIRMHRIRCGADRGRLVFHLTEAGRSKAQAVS
jgi:hypothetical protein